MPRKLTSEEVKEKIELKFPEKFNFSEWDYSSYQERVILTCNDCGYRLFITPQQLLAKSTKYGCKQCYLNNHSDSQESVISKIKENYGENRFDFSKFKYIDRKTRAILICNNCGSELNVLPADLLRTRFTKQPCKICYKKSLSKPQDIFIDEVIDKFGNKFDLSKIKYINAKTEIEVKCNDCNYEFKVTPDNLLTSLIGCPKCAEESRIKKRTYNTNAFINISKKVHGDKYDYSKVEYIKSLIPVIITCPIHGEFPQTPKDHFRGHGCPKCNFSRKYSKRIKY